MKKILIIEDDPAVLLGLEASLEESEYEIFTASDGMIGYQQALKKKPDLIVLDVMLPNKNGMDICRELRQNGLTVPIILLTSKTQEEDKLKGFECGADDYVTKPFSVLELQARIKVLLRRNSGFDKAKIVPVDVEIFENDGLFIDFKKLNCKKNGTNINLSAKEFQIIKYFIQHRGEVISREMLLDDIWGYENFPSTRTVDNYILNIRKAIEDNPAIPKYIQTIHTVGYKFNIE